MSALTNKQSEFLDRFIKSSARLVVLQNLKVAYEHENTMDRANQVNKNFRTSALLEVVREILEELTENMIYFADLEMNPGNMAKDHIANMTRLMSELTEYYAWACEQVKLKSLRQNLIKNEFQLDDMI